MTGPEHYRKAEELVGYADELPRGDAGEASLFAQAQVHATLALAAALGGLDAIEGPAGGSATGRTGGDWNAWAEITEPSKPA